MVGLRSNLKSEKCYITVLVVEYRNISTISFSFKATEINFTVSYCLFM